MKLFGRTLPFTEKKAPDYDLNGNRFYNEYIIERTGRAKESPLKVSAALRAGLKIAEDVGRMPIAVKRIVGDKKEPVNSTVAGLLSRQPNSWQTPMEFVESVTLKAVFEGVGRAYIVRDGLNTPKELLPVLNGALTLRRDPDEGYVYSGHVDGYGYINGARRADFIEIGNPHWTDISRISPSVELGEIFGLAYALQKRQVSDADLQSLRGFLSFDEALGEDAAAEVKAALASRLPGVPILDSGANFKELQSTAHDMQLLQTRQFIIEEVARAFGIHPLMLGHDAAGQSLTRVVDVADYHINVTLAPWAERWEQAIAFSMLPADQVAEFDSAKLFRMSPGDRAERLAKALGAGGNKPWITEDEARIQDGLNPLGEAYWEARRGGNQDEA